MRSAFRQSRAGVTLIELLIVIGLFALLSGMILPAVNRARESAQVVQSRNNLRQLVLATTMFENSRGFYPPGGVSKPIPGVTNGTTKHAWGAFILPYLDQQAAHSNYRFDVDWSDPANRSVILGRYSIFRSPNSLTGGAVESLPDGTQIISSDYHPPGGVDPVMWEFDPEYPDQVLIEKGNYRGLLSQNLIVRNSEVSDGLSSTLVLIESGGGSSLYREGVHIVGGIVPGASPFDPKSSFMIHGTCSGGGHYPGPFWAISNLSGDDREAYGHHSGIVLAGFADGSVRTLNNSLDMRVFVSLVGISDGKSIQESP